MRIDSNPSLPSAAKSSLPVRLGGSISGFSRDGSRLGLSIEAWNETPGPSPRYSVVSVATGELLYETSKDMRAFHRLLQ